ncbi:CASP-like protein 2A1 [Argentina anserina]|uniref:CASP-like protein 2A1 n=1 Tax=Argentina anserina TaxID=57926 RepID=UPI0021761EF3|nr:CASP-like protein 2A1 [Potentilla anserina]
MAAVVEKSAAEVARGDEVEGMSGNSNSNGSSLRTAETLLRLLPIAPCVAALLVMLHDSQNNEFGSVSYSHIGAFRFLVHANGICAGYALLSAIISAKSRPPTKSLAWTFFCIDQLLTYIILGAGAVSTEILYLAFKGDSTITWSPACESYGGFCHKATTSVVITFLVVACFAIISLISSYKLFSKFDAPASTP